MIHHTEEMGLLNHDSGMKSRKAHVPVSEPLTNIRTFFTIFSSPRLSFPNVSISQTMLMFILVKIVTNLLNAIQKQDTTSIQIHNEH